MRIASPTNLTLASHTASVSALIRVRWNVEGGSRSVSGLVVVSRSANTCGQVIPTVGRGLLATPVPPSEPDATTGRVLSHAAVSGLVRPNLWERGAQMVRRQRGDTVEYECADRRGNGNDRGGARHLRRRRVGERGAELSRRASGVRARYR
jgi:hypothetical protein